MCDGMAWESSSARHTSTAYMSPVETRYMMSGIFEKHFILYRCTGWRRWRCGHTYNQSYMPIPRRCQAVAKNIICWRLPCRSNTIELTYSKFWILCTYTGAHNLPSLQYSHLNLTPPVPPWPQSNANTSTTQMKTWNTRKLDPVSSQTTKLIYPQPWLVVGLRKRGARKRPCLSNAAETTMTTFKNSYENRSQSVTSREVQIC